MSEESTNSSGVWALLFGSIVSLAQFFIGDLINPGGLGLSRWISAVIDIVVLPALFPFIIYLVFLIFKYPAAPKEFTHFALLWLIPCAALRAVSWNSGSDPVMLILVPVLWTALVCGIPFFMDCIGNYRRWFIVILSLMGILSLPFLAATAWWAFFAQKTTQGFLLLGLTLFPMFASLVIARIKNPRN
jgi:hypothetical protein